CQRNIMNSQFLLTCFKFLGLCCVVMVLYIYHTDQKFSSNLNYYFKSSEILIKKNTNSSLPLYYVESSKCKIPYVDPFAADVMEIYRPEAFETCSNESDLVRPIYHVKSRHYVLHINSSWLDASGIQFKCYYQQITRNYKREVPFIYPFKLMPPVYFQDGFQVPPAVEAMFLTCHKLGNASSILQTDAFALVQDLPAPQAEVAGPPPSVIMFGIDTMSRINIRRMMPNTFKYLNQPGWYEMQGYNKVADNTFPNLLAVLSGYSTTTAREKICSTDTRGCLDKFPFIWKYLKQAGYLTAYWEDATFINTFTLHKPGFRRRPTDYYHLLFMKAFEQQLESWKCQNCSMVYCYGRRVQSSYVYDFMREYAKRYVAERPVWGLFWSSSFTHEDFSLPSKMDNYILQYLKDFQSDGVLDESIVIFFSDHGPRFGELRNLSSGFLESRLPMLFIYLPPWFRAQYPEYVRALELNRNRLTSNYDLHNTLKHIIEIGAAPKAALLPKSASCDKCQSLFYPVEEQRSCADAGIPDHFCTCEPFKPIKSMWTARIAELVIERINHYLRAKNFSHLCANLTLKYVENVEMKIDLDMKFHDDNPTPQKAQYHTTFVVEQHDAIFFATAVYDNKLDTVDVDVETISRLNGYGTDAYCIQDKVAQLYCICEIQLG
ncbi:hypothetical protein KR044_004570, partial [Drosophila immigrans]